jgi:5-methyltetrahydropteroyltriglutamate--homocysteine methyltransferase
VVGRENVIAGVDCGFGTFAGRVQVDSKIVWLKLQSLAEGARRASAALGEGGVTQHLVNGG